MAFNKVKEVYNKNKNIDVFFGNVFIINEYDTILQEIRYHPFSVEHLIYYGWNLTNQAAFFKRNVFEKIGFLSDYPVGFDWDWFIRLGKAGSKFHFIHEFLGAYRMQANSKLFQIRDRDAIESEILLKNCINQNVRNKHSFWNKCRKFYYMIIKLFYHFIQADFGYIIFMIKRKILSKF